ncbi:MAG: SDR family NAD(P)-dependent oxidoreductase [Wenzhouxiangellaceae bacterium]|nr:SDR family NAD(P)-dependent oxidoreductase [Wenzhouxiangellaceae bacterium]
MQQQNRQADRKVAVITGAGSGLGAAMSRRFASAGWQVVVTDQHVERAEKVAGELEGSGHLALALDVTEAEQWRELAESVESRFGRVDVLVNNAGVATGGMLGETPLEDWQWVLDINLMGVVRGCHFFVEAFRRQRFGHVVNVASWAGLAGAPGIASYGTAKAAVVALSEMLRAELKLYNVEVSVLCPAFVKTALTDSMRAPDDSYARRVSKWMEHSGVSAEDVAEVVYQATLKPRFLLLTHADTRWQYRLKRWFPSLYFGMLMRTMRKLMPAAGKSTGPAKLGKADGPDAAGE